MAKVRGGGLPLNEIPPEQRGRSSDFFRFLKYVKPYTGFITLAAVGGVVKFCGPMILPLVIKQIIDTILPDPVLSDPEKIRHVLYHVLPAIGFFIVIYLPWTYIRHFFAGKAGHKSVFDLRCDLYDRILRMSLSFFRRNKSGEIAARLISDIPQAQNLVGNALTNIWMDGAAVFIVIGLIMSFDTQIVLVALATIPIHLFLFKQIGSRIRSSSYNVQKEMAVMSGNVSEKIAGSVVIHAFSQESREKRDFDRHSDKLLSKTMRTVRLHGLNVAFSGVLVNIAPLLVVLTGAVWTIQGKMTLGEIIAVVMLLPRLYFPLERFTELNVIFANSLASLRRIFELMDEEPEIRDKPDAREVEKLEGRVEFRHVHFSYGKRTKVLRDVDFTVEDGRTVALVGPSGAGKTTLINLIPRFFDVTKGSILIDGNDVRDLKYRSLRKHISLVLQDPIVFSGTLRDNILYGKPEATDRELVQAAKSAKLYGFIKSLPDGFDTEIGERGTTISGGQKQRLTIARAFIKDPEILILDEATSSLDAENERLIQDALEKLMENRTTFIIAHRLSTIINADEIIVLDQGRIIARGRHRNLMKTCSIYKNLYKHQFYFNVPEE